MPVISVILAIHCRGCIQYSHFCVYDYLFLLQANFKTGQIVAEQLYSSATPTEAAVGLAKEDHKSLTAARSAYVHWPGGWRESHIGQPRCFRVGVLRQRSEHVSSR